MTHRMNCLLHKRAPAKGLILLIVLGMLALFTLLAVTYVVSAGASRTASDALRVRARNDNVSVEGNADKVARTLLRGTNDQSTPFYRVGNLLEDIYGSRPITTRFGHYGGGMFVSDWCRMLSSPAAATPVKLVKVSLVSDSDGKTIVTGGPLSPNENEYVSRVMTVLEGPLAGHSFRILKYVGYVRGPSMPDDTNLAHRSSPITANQVVLPWAKPDYVDPEYFKLDYSVLIDLNDVWNETVSGQYFDSSVSKIKSLTLPVKEWVASFGVTSLFYLSESATVYNGYSVMINDAAFNSPGVGITDVGPGSGSIDARDLMAIPSNRPKISPALLTHYDYLQNPGYMNTVAGVTGVPGIGVKNRQSSSDVLLNGSSNEGIDVADWRDPWLSSEGFVRVPGPSGDTYVRKTIPSFHRPEVINHIAHLFDNPASMTANDVVELLRLVDAATGRIMRYNFNGASANPGFRSIAGYPGLLAAPDGNFNWSNPPQPNEILALQNYISTQINGVMRNGVWEWDVDNDGDGIKEAVLINPGLPTVYSPEGKLLRPLAAVTIRDLDSRVNINTAGDRLQPFSSFMSVSQTTDVFKSTANSSQGMGAGPADISLVGLFGNSFNTNWPLLLTNASTNNFSIFDDRYGARRYQKRPIVLNDIALDRVPGKRPGGGGPANDYTSQVFEREIHTAFSHGSLPGYPLGRRTTFSMGTDRLGNLSMVQMLDTDVDPNNPAAVAVPSETDDDPYEARVSTPANSDDPFGLDDLQSILLRYQGDYNSMPRRLRERLMQLSGYSSTGTINDLITTRSAELRYPNLVAAAKITAPYNTALVGIDAQAPSMVSWVRMMHQQRYQIRTLPTPAASDDPDLTNRAIEELFPIDFAKGLRMNLNRPLGNGLDDDSDGQVDEPQEISAFPETELFYDDAGNLVGVPGAQRRELQETMGAQSSGTRGMLGSRQILARNLYCLAQMIVPRDFQFPGMPNRSVNLVNARIRAAALAQWAVNVVDFRDADAAMTRFEYDIFPFGCGTTGGTTARPAYWAPDHLDETVNGVANKDYVGVVWGMEMPELLITESLGLHDTRNRDTDMDPNGKLYDPNDTSKDQDTDQYRFPLASLFLELYCPRTTNTVSNTDANTQLSNNIFVAGAPRSLYVADSENHVSLDLGRMAPANATWGSQPVWRIAISEFDKTNNPNTMLEASQLGNITHQASTAASINGSAWVGGPGPVSPDAVAGNGLRYDLSDISKTNPVVFDRFVWFANVRPGALQQIPDLKPALAGYPRNTVYYNRSNGLPLLRGGSYLVVGPRSETPIGSSSYNRFTNVMWDEILKRTDLATATKKPILSPSYQRISLATNTVSTRMMNDTEVNAPWMSKIKTPVSMVCAADEPDDPSLPVGSDWDACFPTGVGLNISFPTPYFGNSIWDSPYLPSSRLNSIDKRATRADGTNGYGDPETPPDSWIDVGPAIPTGTLPDHPFDRKEDPNGPQILNSEIRKLGLDNPDGTHENIRAAYLQRLADPELGYDPISNPYITVDWISLDLTVFNGEAPQAPGGLAYKFQSRYKDGRYVQSPNTSEDGSTSGFSYHSPMTRKLENTVAQPDPTTVKFISYFKHQLGYRTPISWVGTMGNCGTTLGHLNAGFTTAGPRLTAAQMADNTGANTPLMDGFGTPVTESAPGVPIAGAFWGSPRNITSVSWLNRPFASPHELLLVPACNPGQFGLYHSSFTGTQRKPFLYLPSFQTSNPSNTEAPVPANPNRSYWMTQAENPSTGALVPSAETDFMLLLEMVETLPPFVDAHKVLRPDIMLSMVGAGDRVAQRFLNSFVPNASYGTNLALTRGPTVLAPFNLIPSYVAAGKINLNMITRDSTGFSGALNAIESNFLSGNRRTILNDSNYVGFQNRFMDARRGYTPANSNFFAGNVGLNGVDMNPEFPTHFAGAFRPASSANLAPPVPNPEARARMRGKYGVEATLARSNNPTGYAAATTGIDDQFMLYSPDDIATGANRVNQSAFSRLQREIRLPNLVTSQSNVFAVWVTVSLYEYDAERGFGNEYLDETGRPKREKSFYIIDRSIPVGFKPGEDLNVDKTILLKRKLD